MIWSFAKIAIFVAAVAAATLGAGYIAEAGGGIRIAIANQEFTFGPVQSVLTIAVFLVALWLTLKILSFAFAFIRFVNGDETAISRHFDRNRERKGFQALTDGMMALASGDGPQAVAFATKADRFLKRPELDQSLWPRRRPSLPGTSRKADAAYRRLAGGRPDPVRGHSRTDEAEARRGRHGDRSQARREGISDASLEQGSFRTRCLSFRPRPVTGQARARCLGQS
jgi:hypothetical protein